MEETVLLLVAWFREKQCWVSNKARQLQSSFVKSLMTRVEIKQQLQLSAKMCHKACSSKGCS